MDDFGYLQLFCTLNTDSHNSKTLLSQITFYTRNTGGRVHAYASISGHYRSLTKYEKDSNCKLVGSIKLPIAVGVVGEITDKNPVTRTCMKIMGVSIATELAEIIVAAGLAQNIAALRAIVSEDIQQGHMKLHMSNLMNWNYAV